MAGTVLLRPWCCGHSDALNVVPLQHVLVEKAPSGEGGASLDPSTTTTVATTPAAVTAAAAAAETPPQAPIAEKTEAVGAPAEEQQAAATASPPPEERQAAHCGQADTTDTTATSPVTEAASTLVNAATTSAVPLEEPCTTEDQGPGQETQSRPQPAPHRSRKGLRTDCEVRSAYKLGKTLGTGGYATVRVGTDRKTKKEYAVKIMQLPEGQDFSEEYERSSREDILKEIDILCELKHPNVVYLREYFDESDKVYLITELVKGGELLEALMEKGNYTEKEGKCLFRQLLEGIEYLHSRNVVHRDLKLENLLLTKDSEEPVLKIADFGLAKQMMNAASMSTICGTPQYVAPEIIMGTAGQSYGPEVDMWSAGVVVFTLLGGYPPFWNDNEPALFEQIRLGTFSFDDPNWTAVSDVCVC